MQSFIKTPPTIQAFFIENGQKMEYEKKQTFVRADDPQPWVYFLSEGIVEATFYFDGGDAKILGYFIPNSVFSQNKLFYETDGDLTYTTVEKTVIYRIHRDVFLEQIETNTTFIKEYLRNTLIFRIYTTDLVTYLGENKIHNRCIRWLLLMAKYYGEPTPEGTRIAVPLTQDTIANFLHISRESVSKTLRHFIRSNHISITKKRITITDINQLKSLLDY